MGDVVCISCSLEIEDYENRLIWYLNGQEVLIYIPLRESTYLKLSSPYADGTNTKVHPKLKKMGFSVQVESRPTNRYVDKTFDGDEDQALAAGWVENEFGMVCPECNGGCDTGDSTSNLELKDILTTMLITQEEP